MSLLVHGGSVVTPVGRSARRADQLASLQIHERHVVRCSSGGEIEFVGSRDEHDRRFQPADVAYLQIGEDDRGRPRFDRKQLVLTSPLVAEPVHFRYAWARNPLANLQVTGNKDLPFATQRSDDWDMGTVPLGVLDEPIDGKLTRAQRGVVLRALRAEDLRRRLAEARALLEEHAEPSGGR